MRTGTLLSLVIFLLTAPCCGGTGNAGNEMEERNMTASAEGEILEFREDIDVAGSFAERFYRAVPETAAARMQPVGLPVDPEDVMNLEELMHLTWLGRAPESLLENGFTVYRPFDATDDPLRAFATLEGWDQPVYVSSGIPLHMLHIFFDQVLQNLEEDYFFHDLKEICSHLYEKNLERGNTLNAGYFAVPLSFLDSGFQPDPSVAGTLEQELRLIEAHEGFAESPLMGYREDYSQYVPRGHYTASRRLEDYFRAMMWLGRLTFLLNGGEPNGPSEIYLVSEERARLMTVSALLTVSDLQEQGPDGGALLEKWKRIYELTAFFAGFADDLSLPEYSSAAASVGGTVIPSEEAESRDFYIRFRDHVNDEFAGPSIYSGTGGLVSMPDGDGDFDTGDLQQAFETTTGFRFMGQRYTPDGEILGKLVFPAVGPDDAGGRRFMPTGLDVAAAFGSPAAADILEEQGDFDYAFYADSLRAMSGMIDGYSAEEWHATLYMSWLHCLYLLLEERGAGYPDFMQTDAWDVHTLSSFLASWAMLRHDTILYAKQSYTMEAGCAPGPHGEAVPSAGFVEPVPAVYAQLNATLEMARRGLEEYGVLDGEIEGRFRNACSVMARLEAIAEGELADVPMSREDAEFLKDFASHLESSICWGGETTEGLETSLIADVHTDQNSGLVLEAASGDLDFCIVIYRRPDGFVEAAVGPVLSYYEFTWPMSDRLTDRAWRDMLGGAEQPVRPSWAEVEGSEP